MYNTFLFHFSIANFVVSAYEQSSLLCISFKLVVILLMFLLHFIEILLLIFLFNSGMGLASHSSIRF